MLSLRVRFRCERKLEYSLFYCFFFYFSPHLALSKAKKSIKEAKNIPFHTRSGNEP